MRRWIERTASAASSSVTSSVALECREPIQSARKRQVNGPESRLARRLECGVEQASRVAAHQNLHARRVGWIRCHQHVRQTRERLGQLDRLRPRSASSSIGNCRNGAAPIRWRRLLASSIRTRGPARAARRWHRGPCRKTRIGCRRGTGPPASHARFVYQLTSLTS